MPEKHEPSPDKPWVRVRDADGHEFDRHYQDAGIGTAYDVVDGYPPNVTAQPRPHKYRTEKDGAPAMQLRGATLDQALEAAGITVPSNATADEKRTALAQHEAETNPDTTGLEG